MTWHGYAAAGMVESHPMALDGTWAKMRHAETRLRELIRAADEYVASPPYRVKPFVSASEERWGWRAESTRRPPLELSLMLGDVVHNLRSALDHMTWAFARTVHDQPSRMTQFPIFDEAPVGEFRNHRYVRDVPAEVAGLMEVLQPYSTDDDVGRMIGEELVMLRELSNRDKHRVLLIAQTIVMPGPVFSNTPQGQDSGIRFEAHPDGNWASISLPIEAAHGPYTPSFDAEVTIVEPGLQWRSGLQGIAPHLFNETNIAIGAFRGHWSLLRGLG